MRRPIKSRSGRHGDVAMWRCGDRTRCSCCGRQGRGGGGRARYDSDAKRLHLRRNRKCPSCFSEPRLWSSEKFERRQRLFSRPAVKSAFHTHFGSEGVPGPSWCKLGSECLDAAISVANSKRVISGILGRRRSIQGRVRSRQDKTFTAGFWKRFCNSKFSLRTRENLSVWLIRHSVVRSSISNREDRRSRRLTTGGA